ncbi:MAG TPA: NfeD family protein [Actinomycetota bacterium]|nr:NfeD family protein [Actinomycetota bacterium]
MRRAVLFLLLAFLTLGVPRAALAQTDEASVQVVKVDGSIDRTVAGYLRDAIADAEAEGATVVLQLDSAGTLDQDAIGLAELVHRATVPVIVWVGPAPAKAKGAGLLLMYAASVSAVAPGAGVGPLLPLDLAGGQEPPRAEVEDLVRSWIAERARPPVAFPDGPVPAQAALNGNIAQIAAVSVTELLEELDGRTVTTAAGRIDLRTRIATAEDQEPVNVRFVDLGPVDRVLHAAASPTWIYVLLVLGLAALAFELTQPGFGFAGFSGVAMVALATYGLVVVPIWWLGLGTLLLGIGLMTFDVLVRRLGPATWAGLAAFVAGSLLAFRGVSSEIDPSPWLIGGFAVSSLLYWGFGLTVAIQSRERLTTSQRGLVGLVGEARGELRPEGPVFVKGALWRGRSADGPIPAGTRIRVRGVDGLILRVEPEPERPPGPEPPSED